MDVIPAIDLLNGRSVRLAQGAGSAGESDPLDVARWFLSEGAERLHVTDLNGALEGTPRHLQLIQKIMEETRLPIQVAGGFRRIDSVDEALRQGIDRVILGQGAIESPVFLEEACQRHGEKIALSVEITGERITGREWSTLPTHLWRDILQHADTAGLQRLIVTEAGRSPDSGEPPFEWLLEIRRVWTRALVVAGGITSLEQLRGLAALGNLAPEAVVVGTALHERYFNLREARQSAALVPQPLPRSRRRRPPKGARRAE